MILVQVQVGAALTASGGPLQFIPANITASNGTTITFVWQGSPGNHSVTQSSASNPCTPLSGGFDSGFLFVPANLTSGFPTWNLTVTDDSTRESPSALSDAQSLTRRCHSHLLLLRPAPARPALCQRHGWVRCVSFPLLQCVAHLPPYSAINAPTSGNGSLATVKALAMSTNGTNPGQPTAGAPLQGVGVSVTDAPGPVGTASTGVQGLFLPGSSTASGASSGSGASSSGSAGSSGAAPSPTSGSNGAMQNGPAGLALLASVVFGALFL
jgi:hypothetical protein